MTTIDATMVFTYPHSGCTAPVVRTPRPVCCLRTCKIMERGGLPSYDEHPKDCACWSCTPANLFLVARGLSSTILRKRATGSAGVGGSTCDDVRTGDIVACNRMQSSGTVVKSRFAVRRRDGGTEEPCQSVSISMWNLGQPSALAHIP